MNDYKEKVREGRRKRRHMQITVRMKELGYCGIHAKDENNKWICIRRPHPGSSHHHHVCIHMSRFKLQRDGTLLKDGKILEPLQEETREPTREALYKARRGKN